MYACEFGKELKLWKMGYAYTGGYREKEGDIFIGDLTWCIKGIFSH